MLAQPGLERQVAQDGRAAPLLKQGDGIVG
jgi:hypothetical protein